MAAFKLLGINDEVTTCECCGKPNLKCTVVLGTDGGEVRYGRDCAARALAGTFGRPKTAERIEREARDIQAGFKPRTVARPYFYANGSR